MEFGPIRLRWAYLFCLVGLVLLPPVSLLVVFATYTPITTSGLCYTLGAVGTSIGLLVAPWLRKVSWLLTIGGVLAILATAAMRLSVGGDGTVVKLITLPDAGKTRWVDRLIHERDLSLFGQRVAALAGVALSRREATGLTDALAAAYERLAAVDSTTSSPCLATYLFMEWPSGFDTVVVEPPSDDAAKPTSPQAAVIYLHGFTGGFTIQAWLIAEAARKLNMLTVAPSMDFTGAWWTPRGEETLRRTIKYLHGRGIRRIYLAGLSNGAVGVCRLALRLKSDLAGVVLLSGSDSWTQPTDLPALSLQGKLDERMPADEASAYIQKCGDLGTYVEFADGDHLLLAKHAAEVQAALEAWLCKQEEHAK